MQFRLTRKYADDCKIKSLRSPTESENPLDDWFVDCFICERKKVAMFMHAKTKFVFFIPYSEAGGAKKVFGYFKTVLADFFNKNHFPRVLKFVDELYQTDITFTKTVDRKILGHMNDFIRCCSYSRFIPNWRLVAFDMNNMPINAGSKDASYPMVNLNKLLNINLPTF